MISTSPRGPSSGGTLREMTVEQCWEHLSRCTVGRMAYNDRDGPVVVPLNYCVADGRIFVRTASYDQLAIHLPHQQAAFEVDQVDEHAHSGWSILLRGRAEHVVVGLGGPSTGWPNPAPWPEGVRRMTFSLLPREITGRILTPSAIRPGPEPAPGAVQRRSAELHTP